MKNLIFSAADDGVPISHTSRRAMNTDGTFFSFMPISCIMAGTIPAISGLDMPNLKRGVLSRFLFSYPKISKNEWRKIGMENWADEENLNLLDKLNLIKLFKPYNMNFGHIRFFGLVSNLIVWRNNL